MRNAAFLLILFLAISASAQPPVIDSMLINEANGILSIYGDFGGAKGKVWCDSVELQVVSWSDTLIFANIPDSGKGSAGPVMVGSRGYQSSKRNISQFQATVSFGYNRSSQFISDLRSDVITISVRLDVHSSLIHKSSNTSTSSLRTPSSYFLNFSSGTSDIHGNAKLLMVNDKTIYIKVDDQNYGSGFKAFCLPQIEKKILSVDVLDIRGFTAIDAVVTGGVVNVEGYPDFPVSNFTLTLPLDSNLDIIKISGYFDSSLKQNTNINPLPTLFPPPQKAIALQSNPSIIAPANGSKNLGTDDVRLGWDLLNLMESYHIQVSKDSIINLAHSSQSQQSVKYVVDTISALFPFTLPHLEKNTKYFWRVCGVNSEGESRWSDVWSFTTGEQADVKEQQQQEAMLTCYPNPASKEMIVRYTIADGSPAKILLYDMGGKLCKSQDLFPGRSEARLDVNELAGGMYVVGVVSGASQRSQLVEILR